MNNQTHILKWATDSLVSKGYAITKTPEIILQTPWSLVVRLETSNGFVYLKRMPAAIAKEPYIIQVLSDQLHANVPNLIDINDDQHCFLMKDMGQNLRQYLKADFQPNILAQAVKQYTTIQRSTEQHIGFFLALEVPDWRLDKLPALYNQLIQQEALLKGDGLADKELQILHDLSPTFSAQCERLAQYQIPQTINIPDINTNNVLIEPHTKQFTCIDWGEAVITHPFFSLHNYLLQATIHHSVKESDPLYQQIMDASIENWLDLASKTQLLEAFAFAKKMWPIYFVLGADRLINAIGLQAFNAFYVNRPHRIAQYFREYILATRL